MSALQINKSAKIYVAGHRGMVGSAIWKNLSEKGYENLIGKSSGELDLRDSQAVSNFFSQEKPEWVFLAAAKVGGIMANNTYRGEFLFDNLSIQNNIIHQSHLNGVKKLLFLGSTCIYPKFAPQPIPESALLTGPLEPTNEPYALAKIAGIKMCESYNLQYGTNFISAMPTNLYGPGDNFDLEKSHVLPALMKKMHIGKLWQSGEKVEVMKQIGKTNWQQSKDYLENKGVFEDRVEIWGTGTPLREFMWSEDLADACVHLMENCSFNDLNTVIDGLNYSHVNIGTGVEISIGDLARKIKKVVGYNGDLFFNPNKPDGTPKKLTDVSKLNALGYRHKISLNEGLQKMYDSNF